MVCALKTSYRRGKGVSGVSEGVRAGISGGLRVHAGTPKGLCKGNRGHNVPQPGQRAWVPRAPGWAPAAGQKGPGLGHLEQMASSSIP